MFFLIIVFFFFSLFFFFFQAEDGIRDLYVTGVQTCALPISTLRCALQWAMALTGSSACGTPSSATKEQLRATTRTSAIPMVGTLCRRPKIGRASCRERV